jgi:6-phosphogluconolactonase
VAFDAGGRFALAADLGIDRVLVYRLERGALTPNEPAGAPLAPGSGPRHIAFRPDGRFLYCINEIACTMTAFKWDGAAGALSEVGTVPLLETGPGPRMSGAEVAVHPSGKFVYGSTRGADVITVFAADPEKGTLTAVERRPTGGKTPRSFAVAPGGRWLLAANQDSDSIALFRIDPATGRLEPTGETVKVPAPVCVTFVEQEAPSGGK